MIFNRVEVVVAFCAILLCFWLSTQLIGHNPGCVVIVSGESITINGCVWDDNFTEYAKSLRVAKVDLP